MNQPLPDPAAPPPSRRTWTPPEVTEVRQVRDLLSAHHSECYNAPGEPCGECDQCILLKAIERLTAVTEPPDLPVEKFRDRLHWNGGINVEAYFLDVWQREQDRARRLNGSRLSTLEHLLGERPTFRDAAVAASVIQWLGTNCGRTVFGQLADAEKRCLEDMRAMKHREQQKANGIHIPDDE